MSWVCMVSFTAKIGHLSFFFWLVLLEVYQFYYSSQRTRFWFAPLNYFNLIKKNFLRLLYHDFLPSAGFGFILLFFWSLKVEAYWFWEFFPNSSWYIELLRTGLAAFCTFVIFIFIWFKIFSLFRLPLPWQAWVN